MINVKRLFAISRPFKQTPKSEPLNSNVEHSKTGNSDLQL